VRDENGPRIDLTKIKGKFPLLGVCYGAQYLAHFFGGEVAASDSREYGRANLRVVDKESVLLQGISENSQVWMSHGDTIISLPENYKILASTVDVENAAYKIGGEETYAIQFHPEVFHTTEGTKILENFLVKICGCKQDWTPDSFIETTIQQLRDKIGSDKVVLGLSGGVDSSVAGVLLHKAIGRILPVFLLTMGCFAKMNFRMLLIHTRIWD